MVMNRFCCSVPTAVGWLFLISTVVLADEGERVGFHEHAGSVNILIDGEPVATYVFNDEEIPRPYFAHVRGPGGAALTRNHPPMEGSDATDHATFHPGIWLAFGRLGGSDYWRNKAQVRHDGFVERPSGGRERGTFAVRNLYLDERAPERLVCTETCRISFYLRPAGYLIVWDSTFRANGGELVFGDQEEMGLGVRVATAITEKNGGQVRDAEHRTTAREIWGNSARWCDYSGIVDGRYTGITLMCHPDNFRPSWFHVRDYGLMLANPFGREAFGKGAESHVVVQPGDSLRLQYGVLLHASSGETTQMDLDAAFEDYLDLTRP